MLTLNIAPVELFDESRNEFLQTPAVTVQLEHSLVSISKWESKWEIPFLGDKEKSDAMVFDYIRMMNLRNDTPDEAYQRLTKQQFGEVNDYISAKMTATFFAEDTKKAANKQVITSELIYYWMISLSIPFECQYWHLSRLLTLIRVCSEKNAESQKGTKGKLTKAELMARNRELNAKRKAQLGTSG